MSGSVSDLQLEEIYTWVVPGNAGTNLTLTYPTTYLEYNNALSAATAKPLQTTATCAQSTDLTGVNLPQSADPSSLIAPSSVLAEDALLPPSILSYLDSLPEVQQQLNSIPLTSCVMAAPPNCTTSVVELSTSCKTSTSGNRTRTFCSEMTMARPPSPSGESSAAEFTTATPILVPRKPAAYLTYSTLSLSGDADLPVSVVPDVIATPTYPNHKQTPERETETVNPPDHDTGSAPVGELPPHKTAVPESSPDGQDSVPNGNGNTPDTPQEGSGSGLAGIGNLWSAIQSVASNVANPQGPVSTSPPPGPSGVDQAANSPPVFTFDGQTLSPGNAATFGGSPVSEAPGRDGIVIDGTQTVLVSEGQVTTVQQSGLGPFTVSRSGSVLIVDGQTLSPGQPITAGQATVSLAQSPGVLYVNGAATTLAGPSITIGGTVYTAQVGASTSGGDLGGYIYSGVGGSATSGSSSNSNGSANETGSVTPSTGSGSRMRRWDAYSWGMITLVLWLI
ncbi:hypothetical protein MBLNU13_g09985t1 [Cladosporium sp. NU13]